MQRSITLKAEPELIRAARMKAARDRETLTAVFQRWLAQYVGQRTDDLTHESLMERLRYAEAGRPFSRAELNER